MAWALQPEAEHSVLRQLESMVYSTTLQASDAPANPTPRVIIDTPHAPRSFPFAVLGGQVMVLGFCISVIIFLMGCFCARPLRRAGERGNWLVYATGTLLDTVLVVLRLIPRAFSLALIVFSALALLSPFVTLTSLTPNVFDTFVDMLIFLPALSLLLLCVHDLSLLFKGVPPPSRRPLQALALVGLSVTIVMVVSGSIVDVMYILSLPSVLASGYFEAWWAVVVFPFTVAAILLWGLLSVAKLLTTKAANALTAFVHFLAEPSSGGQSVPPPVDLVTVRAERTVAATRTRIAHASHTHCTSRTRLVRATLAHRALVRCARPLRRRTAPTRRGSAAASSSSPS